MKSFIKQKLRTHPRVLRGAIKVNRIVGRISRQAKKAVPYGLRQYPDLALHGDRVLRELFPTLISKLHVSSFIETGTFKAATTLFIAQKQKSLPIFTCEVLKEHFNESRWRLRKCQNVTLKKLSSPTFIRELTEGGRLGTLPFFFLDAHGEGSEYLPLVDEVQKISTLKKAIIVIDDFLVPGQPQFGYDVWTHNKKELPLDLSLIKGGLNSVSIYQFVFPRYDADDAFSDAPHDPLRGHVLIFMNAADEVQEFFKAPVARFYTLEQRPTSSL